MSSFQSEIKTIEWHKTKSGGYSIMVDQTKIPYAFEKVEVKTLNSMYDAIKTMIVRGAPAIGIAGAHGCALFALELLAKIAPKEALEDITNTSIPLNIDENQKKSFFEELEKGFDYLNSSRPTAVNLSWAITEQKKVVENSKTLDLRELCVNLINNAIKLENEDIEINKKIGDYGATVVPKGAGILTHCNAGALATVGYGTALGVIRSAFAKDNTIEVYADETRPRGQGAKITTFELVRDKIPVTLITDGMCSYFMRNKMIDMVVVGADRIAANGDTANKIGTSTVAIAAKYYNIPFYVAAPKSTIDLSIKSGNDIIIELRDEEEVTMVNGKRICAEGVKIINPSFDVTDNSLIAGIITEDGIFKPEELKEKLTTSV